MKKSILIAICSLLCTSLAFSNCEKAPPTPVVKETVLDLAVIDYSVTHELYVVNQPVSFEVVQDKSEISIIISSSVPDFPPGYFYRNIDYENYLKHSFINKHAFNDIYYRKKDIDPGAFKEKGFAIVQQSRFS